MFNFNGTETTFPLFLEELKFMQKWHFVVMSVALLQSCYFQSLRTAKGAAFLKASCTFQAAKQKSGLKD